MSTSARYCSIFLVCVIGSHRIQHLTWKSLLLLCCHTISKPRLMAMEMVSIAREPRSASFSCSMSGEQAIFERIKLIANLTDIPPLPAVPWTDKSPWSEAWQHGDSPAQDSLAKYDTTKSDALLLAVKGRGHCCGRRFFWSCARRHKIEEWIEEVVHDTPIGIMTSATPSLPRAFEQISETNAFLFTPFQEHIVTQGSRVLLLAACAAGKTLAAWKWAEAQAREHEIGKVIFLYPTRGTATEGFRDYVGWAPETEGALVHGTARYELEAMLTNPSEATEGKSHKLTEQRKDCSHLDVVTPIFPAQRWTNF